MEIVPSSFYKVASAASEVKSSVKLAFAKTAESISNLTQVISSPQRRVSSGGPEFYTKETKDEKVKSLTTEMSAILEKRDGLAKQGSHGTNGPMIHALNIQYMTKLEELNAIKEVVPITINKFDTAAEKKVSTLAKGSLGQRVSGSFGDLSRRLSRLSAP